MLNRRHNSSGMPAYIQSTGLVNHVKRMFLPYSCTHGCLGWAKDAAPAYIPSHLEKAGSADQRQCGWRCEECGEICRVPLLRNSSLQGGLPNPPSANGLRGPPTRRRPSRVIDGVPPNQSLGERQVHPCGPECLDSNLPASGGREAGRLPRTLGHRTSGYWFPASLPAERPTG
jgi:hypothetical protein